MPPPSYSGSPPFLSSPARGLAEGVSSRRARLQSLTKSIPTSQGGAVLVAEAPSPMEWADHPSETSTGNNPVIRLPSRVGSSLQWGEDRGLMDFSGAGDAHQLPGTPSHRAGNEVVPQESQRCDCSAAAGQLNSCSIHQQLGGAQYPLSSPPWPDHFGCGLWTET